MLKSYGFADVTNVAGGMTGYAAAGFSKQCRVCVSPHGARVPMEIDLDVEII